MRRTRISMPMDEFDAACGPAEKAVADAADPDRLPGAPRLPIAGWPVWIWPDVGFNNVANRHAEEGPGGE